MFSEQELEAAVIGGLLAGGATQDAYDVLATLPDDAFSVGYFSRVYREIKKQALTSAIIDPVFIADALGGNGDFAHIMELTRKTISYANLKGYAEKVRNYAAVRKITALINKFQTEITDAATHEQAESVIQKFSSEFTLITSEKESLVLMNPLMILVKIIKLRWIHILSYDQMVSRKINNQTTRCANSIF
ncbi:DnaB-like helicase N-terminal domain-containing protein, partial [Morganella morganii]|uniref:DnaB-like helicase N-terminal domain-containing protein n=1 Tax=Morganella morganii TaxID=582 RepID=UPI003EB75E65